MPPPAKRRHFPARAQQKAPLGTGLSEFGACPTLLQSRYMHLPDAVAEAQHLLFAASQCILALSQLFFIVGGAVLGPVPATAGAVKATARPSATIIGSSLLIAFLLLGGNTYGRETPMPAIGALWAHTKSPARDGAEVIAALVRGQRYVSALVRSH
jgi:hypothetical protein